MALFRPRLTPAAGSGSLLRLLVIILIALFAVFFIVFFINRVVGGGSLLPRVPQTQNGTGVSGSTDARRTLIAADEAEKAKEARARGVSSLPTVEESALDPSRRARQEQAKKFTAAPPPSIQQPGPQVDDAMLRAWLAVANGRMHAQFNADALTVEFNQSDQDKARIEERKLLAGAAPQQAAFNQQPPPKQGLGLGGQRVMARVILAADMDPDSPLTPAAVEMTTGPLKGYRLEGQVHWHENYLTVDFDRLFYQGRTVPVKARLVSPEDQQVTVACDVNHHYLLRIGVPAVVGAFQGLGQAAQESGATVFNSPFGSAARFSQFRPWQIGGQAAGGAAQGVSSVLREALPHGSTVTLCADVPAEVYFDDDVYL